MAPTVAPQAGCGDRRMVALLGVSDCFRPQASATRNVSMTWLQPWIRPIPTLFISAALLTQIPIRPETAAEAMFLRALSMVLTSHALIPGCMLTHTPSPSLRRIPMSCISAVMVEFGDPQIREEPG